jgi:hypothetical protein
VGHAGDTDIYRENQNAMSASIRMGIQQQVCIVKIRNSNNHPQIQPRILTLIDAVLSALLPSINGCAIPN